MRVGNLGVPKACFAAIDKKLGRPIGTPTDRVSILFPSIYDRTPRVGFDGVAPVTLRRVGSLPDGVDLIRGVLSVF